MPIPAATTDFSEELRRLTATLLLTARNAWSSVPPTNITGGWTAIATQLLAQLAAAQIAAARLGDEYVPAVLAELGIDPAAVASVVPGSLAVGSSGVDLATVLRSVPLRALHVASEDDLLAGLEAGGSLLDGIIMTQVGDAGRLAASMRTVASRSVGGYIREVGPSACSRCLVLAGKYYRWSSGFLRHPRCMCVNVPVGQSAGRGMLTDPDEAFRRMSRAQQDRIFTKSGAQAIRDGADISQVVNARRGALGLSPAGGRLTAVERAELQGGLPRGRLQTTNLFGRDVFTTTEGTTRYGLAGATVAGRARLMPESIYQLAKDRDDAIRLLRLNGYLR